MGVYEIFVLELSHLSVLFDPPPPPSFELWRINHSLYGIRASSAVLAIVPGASILTSLFFGITVSLLTFVLAFFDTAIYVCLFLASFSRAAKLRRRHVTLLIRVGIISFVVM